MVRCPRPHCGGSMLLERVDDSALLGRSTAYSEYVCSLCSWSSTPQRPVPTVSERAQLQRAETYLDNAIAGYSRRLGRS